MQKRSFLLIITLFGFLSIQPNVNENHSGGFQKAANEEKEDSLEIDRLSLKESQDEAPKVDMVLKPELDANTNEQAIPLVENHLTEVQVAANEEKDSIEADEIVRILKEYQNELPKLDMILQPDLDNNANGQAIPFEQYMEVETDKGEPLNYIYQEYVDEGLINAVVESAPQEVKEIIACLTNPPRSQKAFPRRLLLVGPPGCGKTTLAKAIAFKTNRKFKFIDAPFLLTEYKNSGPANLQKELLPVLASGEPYVIILDEMTCLTDRHKSTHDSDPRIAEALWSMLDKCAQHPNIFFIGTSNDISKLPGPLRSRFGNRGIVKVDLPDLETRIDILKYHLANEKIDCTPAFLYNLAGKLKGKSGRDIEDLVISAARSAHLRGSIDDTIGQIDFEKALKNDKSTHFLKRIYEKYKPGTENFQLLQFGISAAGLSISIIELGIRLHDFYYRRI